MADDDLGTKNAHPVEGVPWLRLTGGWLFSLAIHLVCCVAGVLLVTGTSIAPRGAEEAGRGVEVVLARRSSDQATTYFSADTPAATQEVADSQPGGSAAAAEAALPDAPPTAASLPSLPTAPGIAAPGGDLVVAPRLTGVGGSGALQLPGLDEGAVIAGDLAEQGRNAGPSGPTAALQLFGSGSAVGRSFVFVFDRSKSMGGEGLGAIEAAAKELKKSIDALSQEQRFQVLAYNEKIVYLDGRQLIPASDENRRRLIRFVADLGAYGPTEHERAIAAALSLKPDVIFLFTDGEDPILNSGQIGRLAREAGRTAIHCIRFGSGPDREPNFMPALAKATRGSYSYVRMP